jgi:hypothetical protein
MDSWRCQRGTRKIRCYKLKYPLERAAEHGQEVYEEIKEAQENPFHCIKKW